MKNSWQIIKEEFIKDSRPKTLGRYIAVNKAGSLFVSLMDGLTDKVEAMKDFNNDTEVTEALTAKSGIDELKEAGVLS